MTNMCRYKIYFKKRLQFIKTRSDGCRFKVCFIHTVKGVTITVFDARWNGFVELLLKKRISLIKLPSVFNKST